MSRFWNTLLRRLILYPATRPIDRERARDALASYLFTGPLGLERERALFTELSESFARARAFATAKNFERALVHLGSFALTWKSASLPSDRCSLLVANCSLSTLSLVADAGQRGWNLIIEDCPFARRFIEPVGARHDKRVEFRSSRFIRARQKEIMQTKNQRPSLLVTFCDRPLWTAGDGLETEVAGGRYYFSILDAFLMVAASPIFVLGPELREVSVAERSRWTTGEINGVTLLYCMTVCSGGLSDLITVSPDQYLGMSQFITRHVRYRARAEKEQKALIKSLLHYGQLNGMALPAHRYRQLIYDLGVSEENGLAGTAFTDES